MRLLIVVLFFAIASAQHASAEILSYEYNYGAQLWDLYERSAVKVDNMQKRVNRTGNACTSIPRKRGGAIVVCKEFDKSMMKDYLVVSGRLMTLARDGEYLRCPAKFELEWNDPEPHFSAHVTCPVELDQEWDRNLRRKYSEIVVWLNQRLR